MKVIRLRQKIVSVNRRLRQARMIAKALKSRRHPVEAQIIPIRRCNLSCTYCNEFDSTSQPVLTEEMLHRVDLLAALGTAAITPVAVNHYCIPKSMGLLEEFAITECSRD